MCTRTANNVCQVNLTHYQCWNPNRCKNTFQTCVSFIQGFNTFIKVTLVRPRFNIIVEIFLCIFLSTLSSIFPFFIDLRFKSGKLSLFMLKILAEFLVLLLKIKEQLILLLYSFIETFCILVKGLKFIFDILVFWCGLCFNASFDQLN